MLLRPRPPRQWSLTDTYGFIASFCHAHARKGLPRSPLAPASRRHLWSLSSAKAGNARASHNKPIPSDSALVPQSSAHAVRRGFHNYFVTHLPSSSLHPDSSSRPGLHHRLPRAAAAPHVADPRGVPAASPPHLPPNRDLTVVRIPLKSAKHHYGATTSRGSRPYNEDTFQAGTIDMPAFAKRAPISLVRSDLKKSGEGTSADSAFGDPQVFYFSVFDGHGGTQCSDFLRDELHGYVEEAADEFELKSSLKKSNKRPQKGVNGAGTISASKNPSGDVAQKLDKLDIKGSLQAQAEVPVPVTDSHGAPGAPDAEVKSADADPQAAAPAKDTTPKALALQKELAEEFKSLVGGYFRRFNSPYFGLRDAPEGPTTPVTIESVLTYAFLRADLDFVSAQARKPDPDDPYVSEVPLNHDEVLGKPHHMPPSGHYIGGRTRFKGGSTASVALISTPTPAPFWHPAASSTLMVGHVGDTRVLLCETATGAAKPLTTDHHPSSPSESHRLRRFAASFVADSFGEERIQGLANSRAFGDMQSKRLGVSAEPEITRVDLGPAEYSFLVLMSDGVSGTVTDQEIVDVVKEARDPDQASRDVVSFATEVSSSGDNATCLVVRLGGWERRSEGGLGSLGTKEIRDFRRNEANDPRRGRR